MPIINFTEEEINKIKGTDQLIHYYDEKLAGFGIYARGTMRTYFVKGRVNGRQVMYALGKVAAFESVKKARLEAGIIMQKMKQGINPQEEKKAAIAAAKAEKKKDITVLDVLDEYLKVKDKKLKESTKNFYRICVEVYLADWKDRPIRDIKEEEVKEKHRLLSKKKVKPKSDKFDSLTGKDTHLVSKVKEGNSQVQDGRKKKRKHQNGPGIADGVMKTLRALCNFAIDEHKGVLNLNPVRMLKGKWNQVPPRENYIKVDNLPEWYKAVINSQNHTVRDALLIILFTGLRSKKEVFSLKWKQIDFTSRTIRFSDTKNSSPLLLPVSDYVLSILEERKRNYYINEFVFAGGGKSGHIVDIRKELNKISEVSKVKIIPHDGRRTFLTYAELLNIPLYTRRALVNHSNNKKKDVTAGYTQVPFEELRNATQLISEYILSKVEAK